MAMSNFISEEERREVLYGAYNARQKYLLLLIEKIKKESKDCLFMHKKLVEAEVSETEVEWLKRNEYC